LIAVRLRLLVFYGADGVVIKFQRNLLRLNTTPSARAKDASRLFLDRAATPPRRGGENSPPHHLVNSPDRSWLSSYAAPRLRASHLLVGTIVLSVILSTLVLCVSAWERTTRRMCLLCLLWFRPLETND